MFKTIQNQFFFLTLSFCLLVPLTHGMQGTFDDDEKSSNASDDYTISNPIVFLAGASKYDKKMFCLPSVKTEMEILYNLFHNKCSYEVRSTFFDEKGNIFPKRPKEEKKKMDGKWLYTEKFGSWLDAQYTYLKEHYQEKKYDGLFFIFSGHGCSDQYRQEYIVLSDGGKYPWDYIEGLFNVPKPHHKELTSWAAKSPKFFFKLACRGEEKVELVKTKEFGTVNLGSQSYTFFATSKGKKASAIGCVKLSEFISQYFSQAIKEKKSLSWIENKLKKKMQKTTHVFDAPIAMGGLVTNEVFFAPRRKSMDKNTKKEWWNSIQKGDVNKVKDILKKYNVDINNQNKGGRTALHYAAALNHVEAAKALIKERAKVNVQDEDGKTPLYEATAKNSVEVATLLLQAGADTELKNKKGWRALHIASEQGHLCSVDVLLKAGADKNIKTSHWLGMGSTPINLARKKNKQSTVKLLQGKLTTDNLEEEWFSAANKGQLELAKLLKERGANIHAKDDDGDNALHWVCRCSGSVEMVTWLLDVCKLGLETKGWRRRTPFLCAADKGQLAIAKLLKQRRANIHAKDKDRDNALHLACYYSGSVEMVTWLLDECKIDIETKGLEQRTPFICAAIEGQLQLAKLLRHRGANINAKDTGEDKALHLACRCSGSVEMVTWLLDVCKLGLETKGWRRRTPFLCAADKGQLAIAKLLKQRRANIHEKDKDGYKALHLACRCSGSVEMVNWLLDVCKIDIESKGYGQKTPFICAAGEGQLSIAKLLKERGANVHATDKDGDNALHYACYFSGSVEMVTWLLDVCKLYIDEKGYYQKTPFIYAAEKGQLVIAKLLRQRGANIHAKDEYGKNALNYAFRLGSVEMVTWLVDECKTPKNPLDKKAKEELFKAIEGSNLKKIKLFLYTYKDVVIVRNHNKKTPFIYAVQNGQLEIAKLLKEQGANVQEEDKDGYNALHFACRCSGSVEMVTWLVDECKTPKNPLDKKAKEELFKAIEGSNLKKIKLFLYTYKDVVIVRNHNKKTPFIYAVQNGQLEIAKLLKEQGANVQEEDKDGYNALHFACRCSGSVEMVTWLVDECKTPKNPLDKKAKEELFKAIENNNIKKVKMYFDIYKNVVTAKYYYVQQTPFLFAAWEGQLTIAKLLKDRGANIHAKDKDGNNALHKAYSSEMVTWLLDVCKIGLETKGEYQKTPFLCAVEKEQLAIAKLLKERAANIYAKDEDGYNALHFACYRNSVAMVTWLLDVCKIDIESKGENERTPFLCAAYSGQLGIVKLLKERGANIHAKSEGGNNALHKACYYSGSVEMVTWLLNVCKIGLESKGWKQRTPFLFAAWRGQLAIAKLLKERGANIHAKDKDGDNALKLAPSCNEEMISYLESLGLEEQPLEPLGLIKYLSTFLTTKPKL